MSGGIVTHAQAVRMRKQFLRLAQGPAGTTVTIERDAPGTGEGVDRGATPQPIASNVPAILERVGRVRREGSVVTLAGRDAAGRYVVMLPQYADMTSHWNAGLDTAKKVYDIEDKLTAQDGRVFRAVDPPEDGIGHMELLLKIVPT